MTTDIYLELLLKESSSKNKISEAKLDEIYMRIENQRLKDPDIEIDRLVLDLYKEVNRLRSICELIQYTKNADLAYKWNERATR